MRMANGSGRGIQTNASGRSTFMRLAHIGLGVKRWLLLWSIGVGITAIGLAFVFKNVLNLSLPDVLPWYFEGVTIGVFGVAAIVVSIYFLYRSVGPLVLASPNIASLTDMVYIRRQRSQGPRVVTIGGGTGMSTLLRGLKTHTDNISAIVTVADDGGSSGRLRDGLGILPPGDFRNCLVALSDDESLVRDLFQYRFDRGEDLEGHSFGNLFIAAMADVTGSLEEALAEVSRILTAHGRVLPATTANLRLSARFSDGAVVNGESNIGTRGGSIEELTIRPRNAVAAPGVIETIEDAEIIVIGPGSLYTSILPNLLVRGIREAVQASSAKKMYVCNVATESGETKGYTAADHVAVLQHHTSPEIADYVIVNSGTANVGPPFLDHLVRDDGRSLTRVKLVAADLIDRDFPVRHDAGKLASCILRVYYGMKLERRKEPAQPVSARQLEESVGAGPKKE